MRQRILIWACALAALFSCSRKEEVVPEVSFHTIPFSVWVSEAPDSRATVSDAGYVFEPGDLLYVSGTGEDAQKLYGFLNLVAGSGAKSARFEGSLYCSDDFYPTDATPVTLTLVGEHDLLHQAAGGKLGTLMYPVNAYADSFAQAVERYSHFTGTGAFADEEFHLSQQSAFLILTLKMNPLEATVGSNVSIELTNDGASNDLWENVIEVKTAGFVQLCIPFEGDAVTLSRATLSVAWGENSSFSRSFTDICSTQSKTLAKNNYYNLSRVALSFEGFRIVAIEENTSVTFKYAGDNIMYSTDLGSSWEPYNAVTALTLSDVGDALCFKGERANYDNADGSTPLFTANKKCYVAGNIMSLLPNSTVLPPYAFRQAFSRGANSDLSYVDVNSEDPLLLPVTTLSEGCYYQMFRRCKGLTWAPNLPATDLATLCYYGIFRQCTNLKRVAINASVFTGTPGDYVEGNYDRVSIKANLDKWLLDGSSTGTLFAHPDMVTYWQNARNSGTVGWYTGDNTFATIPTGWTVSTY